ncbi:hypothetical protein [Ideonella livida]|uniref:Uncharacterized protein n=1 Tax=Ideonella livida TaxID=2707176 RepID=A0A7C9PHC7_9BURK|nr:hypothetical protein [Ideonella livida]NDY91748.1 hypothetical protein [Ideonella livida]
MQFSAALALATTAVGVAMAAAAAAERSGNGPDRWLVTAAAIVLALGAHMLPALARRQPLAWALWLGCVLATLYGHAHFFAAAQHRAGLQRAEGVTAGQQAAAWQVELAAISARPLAVVADEHARQAVRHQQAERAWQRCERGSPGQCQGPQAVQQAAVARLSALDTERQEAQRAQALRERLSQAAGELDRRQAAARQDPVHLELAQLTGLTPPVITLASAVGQSLLVELLAAMLWVLATPPTPAGPGTGSRRQPGPGPATGTMNAVATSAGASVAGALSGGWRPGRRVAVAPAVAAGGLPGTTGQPAPHAEMRWRQAAAATVAGVLPWPPAAWALGAMPPPAPPAWRQAGPQLAPGLPGGWPPVVLRLSDPWTTAAPALCAGTGADAGAEALPRAVPPPAASPGPAPSCTPTAPMSGRSAPPQQPCLFGGLDGDDQAAALQAGAPARPDARPRVRRPLPAGRFGGTGA